MKKITTLLFIGFSMWGIRSLAQDTTKTPDVSNLSAQMWWDLQRTINVIAQERNTYYKLYQQVSDRLSSSNTTITSLQDSIIKLNLLLNPVPVSTKLRGLNVHFGKNNYPDYTADKIGSVIKMNQAIHGNAFRCDVTLNADGSAKYPIFDQFADSCRKYNMKLMAVISQTSADGAGFARKYGDVVVNIQYMNETDNLYELTKLDTNTAAQSAAAFMNRFSQQVNTVKHIDGTINFSWNHYLTPTYFKNNVPLINTVCIDSYNDSEQNSIAGVSQLGQAVTRARKVPGAVKYGITEFGFLITKGKGVTQDAFFTKELPLYKDADILFIYEALNEPIGRTKSVVDEQTLGLTPESVLAISKLIW